MNGLVKWFDSVKGYGFITDEHGEDIFVHWTDIKTELFQTLEEGQSVTFDIVEAEKGKKAVNVIKGSLNTIWI